MSIYGRTFFDGFDQTSAESARRVVEVVQSFVRPAAVVDVGCGTGDWLAAFAAAGATRLLGVDGYTPTTHLQFPADYFRRVDLAKPFAIPEHFDLAVSIEVAEHLPPARAEGFVADLCALAPIVLFSAAIPYQGGDGHLTERWPDEWAALFAAHAYAALDCIRARVWNDPAVKWFHAQNVVLYVRRDHQIGALAAFPAAPPLRLVHPTRYLASADLTHARVRPLLRSLPTALLNGARRTWRR